MNLDLALGHKSPAIAVSWNQRDLLLYQAGVGLYSPAYRTPTLS